MKYSIDLTYETPREWAENAIKDMDSLLQDHADNERKVSAMALGLIAKCPDRIKWTPELIETAIEELEHFEGVYRFMEKRGVQLPQKMAEDKYMKQLIGSIRSGQEERLIDRVLIASIVEMRGMERFKLISEVLEDPDLKQFYKEIWTSEAKHGTMFVKLALMYWEEDVIYKRLSELNEIEGKICEGLEWRSAIH